MELAPFVPDSVFRWRRIDVPGHENARLRATPAGWVIDGSIEVHEESAAASLEYHIACDAAWRTRDVNVSGIVNGASFALALSADGAGHWRREGEPAAAIDGALDIDLGFTPMTNTLPIRRLRLGVGERAAVRTAWLRFPELRVELLDQVYVREAGQVFRYEAFVDGAPFTARLETDAAGRVLRYEGLWEAA